MLHISFPFSSEKKKGLIFVPPTLSLPLSGGRFQNGAPKSVGEALHTVPVWFSPKDGHTDAPQRLLFSPLFFISRTKRWHRAPSAWYMKRDPTMYFECYALVYQELHSINSYFLFWKKKHKNEIKSHHLHWENFCPPLLWGKRLLFLTKKSWVIFLSLPMYGIVSKGSLLFWHQEWGESGGAPICKGGGREKLEVVGGWVDAGQSEAR